MIAPRTLDNQLQKELKRQYDKFGEQNHPLAYWLGILMEEVGEVAKAYIEGDKERYREELVHVMAVTFNMIRSYDRGNR